MWLLHILHCIKQPLLLMVGPQESRSIQWFQAGPLLVPRAKAQPILLLLDSVAVRKLERKSEERHAAKGHRSDSNCAAALQPCGYLFTHWVKWHPGRSERSLWGLPFVHELISQCWCCFYIIIIMLVQDQHSNWPVKLKLVGRPEDVMSPFLQIWFFFPSSRDDFQLALGRYAA